MNKEDSIKSHQFVIRYTCLVMSEAIVTIRKIKIESFS